jgi:hypothetical protein
MSDQRALDLYTLLPALYRLRDAEQGYPLRALLGLIGEQAELVRRNIGELWDDMFIETSAEWVVPYIGDLVANNPIYPVAGRRRADVARTIYYRRRKGTLPMLEELARDVTGWGAHAVAFFELLGWTQHLNHLRDEPAPNPLQRNPNSHIRVGTVNLRALDQLDRLDGPFDQVTHTVDVRPISEQSGWYNIRKVGFFLWRLGRYALVDATPRQAGPGRYHLSPLGQPAPLFTTPEREADEGALATETQVPGPIRPVAFFFDPGAYYGPARSIEVVKDGVAVPLDQLMCKDLRAWDAPPAGKLALDVRLGRMVFAPGEAPLAGVTVSFNYGFSADIGGGPYNRRDSLADPATAAWQRTVARQGADFTSLNDALVAWADPADGNRADALIRMLDNASYADPISLELADGGRLTIEAADGVRPVLTLPDKLTLTGDHPDAALVLNGLVIEQGVALEGALGELQLLHCTLVPGLALEEDGQPQDAAGMSLIASAPNERLRVVIAASITGALRLPATLVALNVSDSIIDGIDGIALAGLGADEPGPPTTLERVTLLGTCQVQELTLASEVIFTGVARSQRRQAGCVRFSHVPLGSQTPRRYRCQPDLALAERAEELPGGVVPPAEEALIADRLRPLFTTTRYGLPGYAQLSRACAEAIRSGAEDGSEMGAFAMLQQPQRETNLRIRLDEYLPFGLEAGLIFVT